MRAALAIEGRDDRCRSVERRDDERRRFPRRCVGSRASVLAFRAIEISLEGLPRLHLRGEGACDLGRKRGWFGPADGRRAQGSRWRVYRWIRGGTEKALLGTRPRCALLLGRLRWRLRRGGLRCWLRWGLRRRLRCGILCEGRRTGDGEKGDERPRASTHGAPPCRMDSRRPRWFALLPAYGRRTLRPDDGQLMRSTRPRLALLDDPARLREQAGGKREPDRLRGSQVCDGLPRKETGCR